MPTLIGKLATTRSGELYPPISGSATLTLGSSSLAAFGGAVIESAVTSQYGLYAVGYVGGESQGANLKLSTRYSFSAYGGGQSETTLTVPTLVTTGSSDLVARAILVLSGYSLISSGTTDAYARAAIVHHGQYTLTGTFGGEATNAVSRYSITATGTGDAYARARLTSPHFLLTASGVTDNHGSVVGTLPTLQVAGSGVVIATLPRGYVTIHGVTQGAVTVEYEAYSFSLVESKGTTQALPTHYTNFPFEQIVRFGNKYFGVAADGLYELGGDTFNGAPIVAVVQTAPTDFKSRELKRPFSLYMGGRVGADFRASVVSAEVDTDSYVYRPVDKTGARNYRVLFGKGIRARYLAYAFTNIDGGDFELDDVTPEIAVLRRTA